MGIRICVFGHRFVELLAVKFIKIIMIGRMLLGIGVTLASFIPCMYTNKEGPG